MSHKRTKKRDVRPFSDFLVDQRTPDVAHWVRAVEIATAPVRPAGAAWRARATLRLLVAPARARQNHLRGMPHGRASDAQCRRRFRSSPRRLWRPAIHRSGARSCTRSINERAHTYAHMHRQQASQAWVHRLRQTCRAPLARAKGGRVLVRVDNVRIGRGGTQSLVVRPWATTGVFGLARGVVFCDG